MRFIIYGAGGIGCVIGGHLFRQGCDVVLVGNAQHVEAINARGLKLVTGDEAFTLKIPAVKTANELVPFRDDDVLLLCAKSQHTVKCLGQLNNAGAPRTLPIFCIQNSILNESIATRFFDQIYGVMIMIPAIFMTPGEVINPIIRRYGVIELGCYPSGTDERCERVAEALRKAGFFVNVHPQVMKSKAAKCLLNLGNSLDAITAGNSYARGFMRQARQEALRKAKSFVNVLPVLMKSQVAKRLINLSNMLDTMTIGKEVEEAFMVHARQEAMQVWGAAGIEWEERESFQKRVRSEYGDRKIPVGYENLEKHSSSWQSLARGTGNIEAEQLNGQVVMLGKQLGIATPYNELLWRVADEMARNGDKPGKYSAADLMEMMKWGSCT